MDRKKLWTTPDAVREPLYVITPLFNPVRYKSRWKLYQRFQKYVIDSGACLLTIEAAFGPDREHAVEEFAPHATCAACAALGLEQTTARCRHDSDWRGKHQYLRVRAPGSGRHEVWLKENLINVALAALPHDAKYVAWVDADVIFARPNWVGATIQALQHYDFVQMFSEYQDLSPAYEVLGPPSQGFAAFFEEHGDAPPCGPYGYPYPCGKRRGRGAPGLAWAARVSTLAKMGGLLDVNVVGAGDWYMAHALIGNVAHCLFPGITPGYRRHLEEWQRRADHHVRRNLGSLSGLALHFFHGNKSQRGYQTRMAILRDLQFDPDLDLSRDVQGVLQLVDRGEERSLKLREALRGYFRSRNEDSIDVR